MKFRDKIKLESYWNTTDGDLEACCKKLRISMREGRAYLSTRPGYPGAIQPRPSTVTKSARLTSSQYSQGPALVTLPRVKFLERRFDWERRT